jgi:hypothetical protein
MTQKISVSSATVYRHVRAQDEHGNFSPKGGFVLAFEMNFGKDIRVGISACRDDENFYKRIGNETALKAIGTHNGITIEWSLYDPAASLVETARAACALHYVTDGSEQGFALKKFCLLVCEQEIESIIEYIEQSGH